MGVEIERKFLLRDDGWRGRQHVQHGCGRARRERHRQLRHHHGDERRRGHRRLRPALELRLGQSGHDADDLRSSSDDDRRAGSGTSVGDQDDLDVAASDDVTLRLSEGR